ncbi:type IX secretion system membrane protein PorP/SprF [Pedobacter sp. HDW13]|uniref:PorP/SprF family type IX secretion system membrane protein n=1 Tax=Pedobacter sp. HDW13 TaxID=2714940 RepID=UPI00140E6940|nr:type IX secretion system membrane protein PorP/SprF [Pedobacter sp. HDW13]QIL38002.1 type IX secretion system membrane protein PorP/SprF [Pedobacter sp. HDW13]
MKTIAKLMMVMMCCFTKMAFAQQDAQFGQYVFNGMYINPAYTGYKEELYLQAFARAQWTGVKGAPQTLSISADEAINDESLGIGAIITKDKIGAQNSLNASVNFAYRIKLDRTETNILAFGLGVGVMQAGLNGNLLDPIEQGDNRIPLGSVSQITPDIRAGIHYSNEKFFIGFSANNLLSKSLSLFGDYKLLNLKIQPHFYLSAGVALPFSQDFVFKPTFLIKDDLHGPTSLDLNAFLLVKERFWIGGVYRSSVKLYPKSNLQSSLTARSAVGLISELFVRSNLRIGYGYDYSLNKLSNYDYGSHEISVGYYLVTKKSRRPKCYF